MAISETDRAWLAGLLEGEGWFGSADGAPLIGCNMTDEDVVRRILVRATVGRVNGPYQSSGNRLPVYRWTVHGYKAAALMLMLHSLMGARRQRRIVDVLEPWVARSKMHCTNGHLLSDDNLYRSRGWRACRECILTKQQAKRGSQGAHKGRRCPPGCSCGRHRRAA